MYRDHVGQDVSALRQQMVGEGDRLLQGAGEPPGSVALQHVGGVGAARPLHDLGLEAVGCEEPVGAFGGELSGGVGVCGHERVGGEGCELLGVFERQRGSERREA